MTRAAETATIKRQETGENHPHKTTDPLPHGPDTQASPAQQTQYLQRAQPSGPTQQLPGL
ncbi:hypothetical protein GCM10028793_62920 [Nocardiopsis oceani]